jgi:hypothetical protein
MGSVGFSAYHPFGFNLDSHCCNSMKCADAFSPPLKKLLFEAFWFTFAAVEIVRFLREPAIEFPQMQAPPKRQAEFIEPMECALVSTLPQGQEWTYEIKLDAYRAIGVRMSSETILYSPQELRQTIPADHGGAQ